MKKVISLLLALSMLFLLCACGGSKIEESLIEGTWVSPNKVEGDGQWTNYSITFYEDGSCVMSNYFVFMNEESKSEHVWSLKGNTITIGQSPFTTKLTYSNENGVERLMESQASGFWYDHITE